MKKAIFAALSLLAFASCTNDSVVNAPAAVAIEFGDSFVEIKTRAAIDPSITTATIDAFDVWGFMNAPTGVVFNGDRVSKGADGWKYDNLQYWTPNNSYYFAAVAPVDDSNITVVDILLLTNYHNISRCHPGFHRVTFYHKTEVFTLRCHVFRYFFIVDNVLDGLQRNACGNVAEDWNFNSLLNIFISEKDVC